MKKCVLAAVHMVWVQPRMCFEHFTDYLMCCSVQGRAGHDDLVLYFCECEQAYSHISLDLSLT